MITVPEVIKSIIRQSPYLEDALAQGIINISALARKILPEVRTGVMKDVREGAVIMALNRLAAKIQNKAGAQSRIFDRSPDLMVRSNLFEITMANSQDLVRKRKELLEQLGGRKNLFVTFTQGIFETTIIASRDLKETVKAVFHGERTISIIENLSSITVQLPPGTAEIPGAYVFILRALAWEQINIVEVVSTYNEFTMILKDRDLERAFSILKRLFD